MKRILVTLLAVAALLPAAAQYTEANPNYVQVVGEAVQEITPDRFYLAITIDERDSKGKISLETRQREMVAALKKLGVNIEKQLKMANLSSSFLKKNNSVAMVQYQLELHSAADVAHALLALDNLGISQVNIQKVTHSQIDHYKAEIRREAIRNARDKAASLAEAIGQEIGSCIYIEDPNREASYSYYSRPKMMRAMANDALALEVDEEESPEFKTIRLQYNVEARFVLKP